MRKSFFIPVIVFSVIALVNSCDLIDDVTPDNTIEGQWNCQESNSLKSTDAEDRYTIYISPDSNDSTKFYISNFYHLGNDVEATAKLNGMTLTLPKQSLEGGYTINSGTGKISSNYKQITWTYAVDDGSGDADNATATYSKVY
ncbi:MAG: hypothetical protein HC906_04885 [Bacteroidales bacterium]|nr:hypothetical protein [Bacteroidales bacterium]